MQEFKIKPDGFKEIRKQILIKTVPIMLIAAAAGIFISSKNAATDQNIYPILIPVIALLLIFSMYRAVSRQKLSYDSYTFTIADNLIKREQLNTPAISIYFKDVRSIKKQRNGGFIIIGKNTSDKIIIPAQIADRAALDAALNQIISVETLTGQRGLQKYQGVFSVAVIGLMVCVYTVTNKVVVAISGLIVIGVLLWGFIAIRNSKNVDLKTKRSAWFMLPVLIAVATIVYCKLRGTAFF